MSKNERKLTASHVYLVVQKLVGSISPIGSHEIDSRVIGNIEVMTDLVNMLICDIAWVANHNKDRHEESMSVAGKKAAYFIKGLEDFYSIAAKAKEPVQPCDKGEGE